MTKSIFNRKKKSEKHPKKLYPNSIPRDVKLDAVAVGIMYYLLSHTSSYRIKKDNVINHFKSRGSKEAELLRAWSVLQSLGYIYPMRVGGKTGVIWIINEVPMTYEDSTPHDL